MGQKQGIFGIVSMLAGVGRGVGPFITTKLENKMVVLSGKSATFCDLAFFCLFF